jgi:hypothetical protein
MMDENVTYNVGGKETLSYEEIANLCFAAAGKEPKIVRFPAFVFDILANLPKIKASGRKPIIQFSKWTLTEEMVGDTVYGDMSFTQYIKESFTK